MHEGIEAAFRPDVRVGYVRNIVGLGGVVAGECADVSRGNVEEFRRGIDEAPDEPGACDAIDLRSLAGHPARRRRIRDGRAVVRAPAVESADEAPCAKSAAGERGGDARAQRLAVLAIDDDSTPGFQRLRPQVDGVGVPADRAGDQRRVAPEVRARAHVDDDRRRKRFSILGEARRDGLRPAASLGLSFCPHIAAKQNLDGAAVGGAGRLRKPLAQSYGAAGRRVNRQMRPSSICTSTDSPAAMLPVSGGSTMKQFACDIEDRMPEPWSPVVRTV